MKKGKDIKNMNQIHGKNEKRQGKNIYQILGYTGIDKYGTMDIDEYQSKIKSMAKADLWKHTIAVGFMPNENIERLQNSLLSEFKRHISLYEGSDTPSVIIDKNKINKLTAILAEGK